LPIPELEDNENDILDMSFRLRKTNVVPPRKRFKWDVARVRVIDCGWDVALKWVITGD